MISDYEIDMVLKLAGHYFDQTKGFRGKLRKQYFLEALGRGLQNKQAGTMHGVCPRCLGTGYAPPGGK